MSPFRATQLQSLPGKQGGTSPNHCASKAGSGLALPLGGAEASGKPSVSLPQENVSAKEGQEKRSNKQKCRGSFLQPSPVATGCAKHREQGTLPFSDPRVWV